MNKLEKKNICIRIKLLNLSNKNFPFVKTKQIKVFILIKIII